MTKITLDFTKFNHQLILDILDYVESDIFEYNIERSNWNNSLIEKYYCLSCTDIIVVL